MPITMSEIRKKYPMYESLPDETLLAAIHKKHYADIPVDKFMQSIDMDLERKRMDPTKGMSENDLAAAGFQKSLRDIGRSGMRVANNFGIGDYDQAAAKADEKREAPLMNTSAGKSGHTLGTVMTTAVPGMGMQNALVRGGAAAASKLPLAMRGIAQTATPYASGAGTGAAIGAVTRPDNMSTGAAEGALAGVGGEILGRVATTAYKGGKAFLEPLYETGRKRIVNRALDRFATNPEALDAALANPNILVPGTRPTLAELTLDPGIANLQRTAQTSSPDVAAAIEASNQARVKAYTDRLRNIAGSPERIEAAEASRAASTKPYYDKAVRDGFGATPEQAMQLQGLMERPSFRDAMARGERMAKDAGDVVSTPLKVKTTPARTEYDPSLMTYKNTGGDTTLEGGKVGMNQLMYAKTGIDDMIGEAMRAGNNNQARILSGLKDDTLGFMGDVSPSYLTGNQLFSDLSAPINRMKAGQAFYDKAVPALNDFGTNPTRMKMEGYANALRNADDTVAKATGFPGAKMDEVFYPHQVQDMNNIGKDMARYTEATEMGKVPGSATAQHLAGQNLVEGILGPLGIPRGVVETSVGKGMSALANIPGKWTGNKTEKLLGEALTDPAIARALRTTKDPKTFMERAQPYSSQFFIQNEVN